MMVTIVHLHTYPADYNTSQYLLQMDKTVRFYESI